jgi:hypothetical protein
MYFEQRATKELVDAKQHQIVSNQAQNRFKDLGIKDPPPEEVEEYCLDRFVIK